MFGKLKKRKMDNLIAAVARLERKVTNLEYDTHFNASCSAMLWGPNKLSVKNVVQSLVEGLGYELIHFPKKPKVEYIKMKRVHKKKK